MLDWLGICPGNLTQVLKQLMPSRSIGGTCLSRSSRLSTSSGGYLRKYVKNKYTPF